MEAYQSTGMVGKILTFAVAIVVIYLLYMWTVGTNDLQDYVIYRSPISGLLAMSPTPTVFGPSAMPQVYGGGEFSISTWIYINNWAINKGKNKVFLTLSGGSNSFSTLVMYLGQHVNKLGIRVSYDTSDTAGSGNILDEDQMDMITDGETPYTDVASDFKKCDIDSVDLQKWVNITVVLSGRVMDVYIDGKLSRSCVLNGLYMVDGDNSTLVLGGPTGFGGHIGQTRGANYAYSPDQVYQNYMNGPYDSSFFGMFGTFVPNIVVSKPILPTFNISFTAPSLSLTPPSVSFQ